VEEHVSSSQTSESSPRESRSSPGNSYDRPAPFLSQPRALSALRHELEAIATAVAPDLVRRRAGDPNAIFELHVAPNRLIAHLGDAGVTFSWVEASGAQSLSVADGRLLVIQWAGLANNTRGVAALRYARPVSERVYRAEGIDAAHWRWRPEDDDTAAATTYTADTLVAEWLAM
jgi:hypothetical protein